MRPALLSVFALFLASVPAPAAEPAPLSVRLANAVLARWPDPLTIAPEKGFEYNAGIILHGIAQVHKANPDPRYVAYAKRWVDSYLRENGSVDLGDDAAGHNFDRIQPGLGLPTAATGNVATPGTASSQFEIASPGEFDQWFHALFLQDDWRVSRKLTVNFGVRLEVNSGLTEKENRNLAGFDTTSPNPIQAQAQAAYARNPIPEVPVSAFSVKGGLLFANGETYKSLLKPLPRGAFSYLLNEKTVIRGGVGLFSYDYFFDNINQQGFSQGTPVLVTQDNGLTFTGANLANPIPGGQLNQPVGGSLGLGSALGQNLTGGSPGAGGQQTSNNLVQPDRRKGVTQALLRGWQLSGTYQYQTGFPIVFGNLYYDASRDPRELASNIGSKANGKIAGLDVPAWDISGFYQHDSTVQTGGSDDPAKQRADQRILLSGNSSYRSFPSTLGDVRNHDLHLMDLGLYKNFKLPRNSRLQIRIEAINALNYTVLFSPDANPRNSTFGFTTADRNNPRDIQLAARFTF